MSHPVITAVLATWANHRDYVKKLVADVSDEGMCSQPIPGITLNHPAWTLSHLTPYPPMLAAMVKGEPFKDAIDSPFAKGSSPSSNPRDYPNKEQILADYLLAHDTLATALQDAKPEALSAPTPLARWQQRFPTIADALLYVGISHEATHLGQLSAWRRAGGRPPI